MKLRDDARGLHAQGEAHELPHGKRLLGMRRLTPVGIPFLQASHISTDDRVFGRGEDVLVRFGTTLETTLSLPTVNSRYLYMRSYS